MKFLIPAGMMLLLFFGCSWKSSSSDSLRSGFYDSGPEKQKHFSRSGNGASQKTGTPAVGKSVSVRSQPRAKQVFRKTGDRLPARHRFRKKKVLLPTIIHPGDRSVMVLVDAGKHLAGLVDTPRGTPRPDEAASRLAPPPLFYMDRLEITVAQYQNFDSGYDEKIFTEGRKCPVCPAMGIGWREAFRYCRWAGKRLPTEAEWIAAARGDSGNPWPWGNKYLPGRANLQGAGDGALFASAVGSYPKGASPFGALDMIGNVWEWVATGYSPPAGNNPPAKKKLLRIVKGGGWTSDEKTARISFRNVVAPDMKNPTFGFRCAKSVGIKTPARRNLRETTRD